MLQKDKPNPKRKHIDIKYHFVKELFKSKDNDIRYCASEHMTADILTKPLEAVKTRQFVHNLGIV